MLWTQIIQQQQKNIYLRYVPHKFMFKNSAGGIQYIEVSLMNAKHHLSMLFGIIKFPFYVISHSQF